MQTNDAEQAYRQHAKMGYTPAVEKIFGMSADDAVDLLLDMIDERIERATQENKPVCHTLCGDAETMAAIKAEADRHKSLGEVAFDAWYSRQPPILPWSKAIQSYWETSATAVASKVRHGYESTISQMAEMLEEAHHIISNGKRGMPEGRWLADYRKWRDGR